MKERRLSSKELNEAIVDFLAKKPVVVDEAELQQRVRGTVRRIIKGERQLDEVSRLLRRLAAKSKNSRDRKQLDLAIKNIKDAMVAAPHGVIWYDSTGSTKSAPILWNPPRARKKGPSKKKRGRRVKG